MWTIVLINEMLREKERDGKKVRKDGERETEKKEIKGGELNERREKEAGQGEEDYCTYTFMGHRQSNTSAYLSVNVCSLSIQPAVWELFPETVVLQDVQHACHLAEDEYTGTLLMQSRKKLLQNTHLAAVLDQVSVGGVGRTWKELK